LGQLLPFFNSEVKESPFEEFCCWSADGDLFAIRVRDWKSVSSFAQEKAPAGAGAGLRP
jgi:hypothetical protein